MAISSVAHDCKQEYSQRRLLSKRDGLEHYMSGTSRRKMGIALGRINQARKLRTGKSGELSSIFPEFANLACPGNVGSPQD